MGQTTSGAALGRYDVTILRQRHPVDEVIGAGGVELRRSGRALVGRCPFHPDGGRPNLHVYPDTQSWYCYRCAVGGDVITFVRRQLGLDFVAACRWLEGRPEVVPALPSDLGTARQGASPVPVRPRTLQDLRRERADRRWERLALDEQVVMRTACAVYQHALWRTPHALAYLRSRAIPDRLIRACALGYAGGDALTAELGHRAGLRTACALGLLQPARGGALRETLAGRIIVPELRGGGCIWLIGRTLAPRRPWPKYLALRGERPVLGQERAAGRREVFLCEGVFDYLTALSWGLPAASPCGTALPADQLGFLARAAVVWGVFDADAAGRAAADRAAAQLGDRFRPLRLPEGCDLNDLALQADGRAQFFRLLAAARRAWGEEAEDGD